MGIIENISNYDTIKVRLDNDICFIQIDRPEAKNTINDQLIDDFIHALDQVESLVKVVVLEGSPEVFCFGADFKGIQERFDNPEMDKAPNPEPMYDLWTRLASGPFISVAHVRGQANAGGIGFVAACDVVICEDKSVFSLSELLFGLMPACVLPFLIRKMGFAKAHYMTLMTEPVNAQSAHEWGLVDEYAENSSNLLRKKLLRFRRLSKDAVARYKRYMNELNSDLSDSKPKALATNAEIFSDRNNLEKIARYVRTGKFPWEEV
ncbi:enoyl-CoA hydratase/isomerase [Teredinibacter sp. KSP-S5-2]|uniref:enoyl-CoA hydratase/isomerase n=1 Tax=Teredinibacter sp. KSP-S5-2 TaxID=3034506 RepID=UPI002934F511|nr:enoyl-CoA hydratase/isomerase [Teredinibacter sp. KSP-S5-2]WNO11552.1 enoyl-CoA hydratase/isomerase [Teredinibacter sp. KSP-S5-2]